MEDRKYKHWMFTWHDNLIEVDDEMVEKFLKTFCKAYVFQKEIGEKTGRPHYQGYFQTIVRKRQQSIVNHFRVYHDIFPVSVDDFTVDRMLGTQEEAIAYCTKPDTQTSKPRKFGLLTQYQASDLTIFNNSVNWYPWQKSFMELIFNKDLTLKDPDDRTILWIHDLMGNNGKSKLVKHICYNYPEDACKLSFGSSTQLRSACIAAGPRKLYFIDVPRTLGKDDDLNDLISVIEDIKNGFIVSSMYGKHQQMMFDPPHIVVFANVFCPENALSGDRLQEFTLVYDTENEFIKILAPVKVRKY